MLKVKNEIEIKVETKVKVKDNVHSIKHYTLNLRRKKITLNPNLRNNLKINYFSTQGSEFNNIELL